MTPLAKLKNYIRMKRKQDLDGLYDYLKYNLEHAIEGRNPSALHIPDDPCLRIRVIQREIRKRDPGA